MFELTKFTGETFLINPETILTIEEAGDTVLSLVTGERVLVKERAELIQQRFIDYKQRVNHQM